MEEILGFDEEKASQGVERGLGQSWEEINEKMKRTLMAAEKSSPVRLKLLSEAASSNKSQTRMVLFSDGPGGGRKSNGSYLKLIHAVTENDCAKSYQKSLSNCITTDQSLKKIIQQRSELCEIKSNSATMSKLKSQPVRLSLNNIKIPLNLLHLLKIKSNNAETPINSINKAIKEDIHANRMRKSHSEALFSQKETLVPAKVDIWIKSEVESSLAIVEKVSQSLALKRSIHLQQSLKMMKSRKESLPYLSIGHHNLHKMEVLRSPNTRKNFLCKHKNLSRLCQLEECKRAHQRELQAQLRRDTLEFEKKGKLFANIQTTRLKLIK